MQANAPASSCGTPFPRTPQMIFANWREGLHGSGLSAGVQTVYCMAVQGYLDYCAHNAISVTVESARAYMDDVGRRGLARQPELWKEGLNWFFRAGRQHTSVGRGAVPALSHADTGAVPWEQRLIERLRIQHYAWRTEQTYREWAWRLADFVRPRELETATGEDIKGFLSELAVKGRVSRSTQKQALNALGATFTVWGSTNVTMALSNWTKLGYVTNISAGQYQFTDTSAPANGRRFYSVSSP